MKILPKHFLSAVAIIVAAADSLCAQNALFIPPAITGTVFNLNIQNGTTQFYPGINTPTYGINGALLAPTLIVNKGDWVTMNVTNSLTGNGNSTTIHWHGMHVPAMYDGGPHQIIAQGTTWSPHFQILNSAATYWYHPHGQGKTDLHVSKGIAGMIIVKDSAEAALTLPRTYGVDDFPIIVQSKAFDVLHQIAVSTESDTAVMVNGTVHPYLNVPSQVIRLRLLNGSSLRTYLLGFTGNQSFKIIASDDGLLDSAITATRIRISPGERYEILIDLQGMNGQTIQLKNFGSELPNGIYGAATVGVGGDTIPYYSDNFLNGADYDILQLNVGAQSASPVLTTPTSLTNNVKWNPSSANITRTFYLEADSVNQKAEGPFNMNGKKFDMDSINEFTHLNDIEIWTWVNHTLVAHPIHIHDMHFFILDTNGNLPPPFESGKKDVVLVMPGDSLSFITRFEDFADNVTPYMFHCHLLHHEDDGMMGSFIVLDTASAVTEIENHDWKIFPNPASDKLIIQTTNELNDIVIADVTGKTIKTISAKNKSIEIPVSDLADGIYFIKAINKDHSFFINKFIIHH